MPCAFLPLLPFDEVLTAEIGELGVAEDYDIKDDGNIPCGPKTSTFPIRCIDWEMR